MSLTLWRRALAAAALLPLLALPLLGRADDEKPLGALPFWRVAINSPPSE